MRGGTPGPAPAPASASSRRNPFAGDVVRLKDYPIAYPRRVGSWRILFDAGGDARILTAQEVARRAFHTYSWLPIGAWPEGAYGARDTLP